MERKSADGIQLLIDSASLYRRERGPIWGRVCLLIGDRFFPNDEWTDIAVGFCVNWLHALRQLVSKETTAETVYFMDGPFRADMKLTSAESVEVVLVNDRRTPERIEHRSEQGITALLRNAITAGQSILKTATEQSWVNDRDVQALRGEIGAAEELLRP